MKEFSKKLLAISWIVTITITALTVWISLNAMPLDAMYVVAPLAWAETATATGYYFWKAKNENRAKYAQQFLENLADKWGPEIALHAAEIVLKD